MTSGYWRGFWSGAVLIAIADAYRPASNTYEAWRFVGMMAVAWVVAIVWTAPREQDRSARRG